MSYILGLVNKKNQECRAGVQRGGGGGGREEESSFTTF